MKNKLFLLLTVIFANNFFSQVYTKLPTDTNYFWRQWSDCGFQYQIRYYNDTTIKGKTIHKYSLFGATTGTPGCSRSFIRTGYLREDTVAMKVYILDSAFIERPLYDFSKMAGDTLLIYDRVSASNLTYTVQSVSNSVQTLIKDGYSYFVTSGVGSFQGGLYACQQSLNPIQTDKLVCYGKRNPFTVLVGPEVGFEGDCYLITGIQGYVGENPVLRIYPNPSSGIYTVMLSGNHSSNTKFVLQDIIGRELSGVSYTYLNEQNLVEINLSTSPSGIYLLNVIDNNRILHSQKLVKN